MKNRRWVDDIENASQAEQEEMTRHPTGGAIGALFVIAVIWTVIAAIIYFGFIQ